jgi:hypothetical protein
MPHSALVDMKVLRDLVAGAAANSAAETGAVYGVVAALLLIGIALAVLAIWLIRQTRPEKELLAPLERMHDRSWRKQEPAQMRRDLDEVRPMHARPVARGRNVPEIDDEFAQSQPRLATFDDLSVQHESGIRPESSDRFVAADASLAPARAVTEFIADATPAVGCDIDQFDGTSGGPPLDAADGERAGIKSVD